MTGDPKVMSEEQVSAFYVLKESAFGAYKKKNKYIYMYMYTSIHIYFSEHQGKKNTETETILLEVRSYYSSYELAHLFPPRL